MEYGMHWSDDTSRENSNRIPNKKDERYVELDVTLWAVMLLLQIATVVLLIIDMVTR